MNCWPVLLKLHQTSITVKRSTKTYIFTGTWEHFTTGLEIDTEVVDGLIHAEEGGNKHFKVFLLEK